MPELLEVYSQEVGIMSRADSGPARTQEAGPTNQELKLVADHGSGPLERALAAVMLAKQQGREDELRRLLDESDNN